MPPPLPPLEPPFPPPAPVLVPLVECVPDEVASDELLVLPLPPHAAALKATVRASDARRVRRVFMRAREARPIARRCQSLPSVSGHVERQQNPSRNPLLRLASTAWSRSGADGAVMSGV
jgi:hypothetical protein